MGEIVFSPTDFVAVLNQTLEYAYPSVVIQGEITNFRVSKNRWVYFDLKDEFSSVKFFGTVHQLPGPLEDGMMAQVRGVPRLHQQYGFSVNVQFIAPIGEGSIKKAAALLEARLRTEGLFDEGRKRTIPYPPKRIGLITSSESAAYQDFLKILNHRWVGVEVTMIDVQVQGELATAQIVSAIEYFNTHGDGVDALILTRGGGSAEDLSVFSTEQVTRAVAASRIPTLVAIGHEVDVSLAELAADQRASTPSNAAELLVPDKKHIANNLKLTKANLTINLEKHITEQVERLRDATMQARKMLDNLIENRRRTLKLKRGILEALSPEAALKRGYAIVRSAGEVIRSVRDAKLGSDVNIHLKDGTISATVKGKS